LWAYFLSLLLGGAAGYALRLVRAGLLQKIMALFMLLMPFWIYVAVAFLAGCKLDGTGAGPCFGLGFVILFLLIAAPLWWIGMVVGYKVSSART
jgi:hypothetical protein